MSVNSRITAALSDLGYPIKDSVYQGPESTYFTFNYSTVGSDYGDDAPQHEIYLVQVHFFAPLGINILTKVRDTKKALFAAGFSWPETQNATGGNGQHIVFECEDAQGVDLDGEV